MLLACWRASAFMQAQGRGYAPALAQQHPTPVGLHRTPRQSQDPANDARRRAIADAGQHFAAKFITPEQKVGWLGWEVGW